MSPTPPQEPPRWIDLDSTPAIPQVHYPPHSLETSVASADKFTSLATQALEAYAKQVRLG